MKKKVIGLVLQLPLLLIIVASFFASIYAAIAKIGGVSFGVTAILGIVIIIYFYGRRLEKKQDSW